MHWMRVDLTNWTSEQLGDLTDLGDWVTEDLTDWVTSLTEQLNIWPTGWLAWLGWFDWLDCIERTYIKVGVAVVDLGDRRAVVNLSRCSSYCIKVVPCQKQFLWRTLMKVEESGRAYAGLGTRQEGGGFEDVGLSVCASPLWILVLGLRRSEVWQSAEVLKVSGGQR